MKVKIARAISALFLCETLLARAARKLRPEVGDGREALLAAARQLLSENEGSRFSLAEVAARSGKNSALVKYYFGGKQQMLMAILKEDQDAILKPLFKLMDSDLPAAQKLERHLSGVVELHARRPYFSALTHELLRRSDKKTAKAIAVQIVRPVIEFQRRLLEQGYAEGAFRRIDPFSFHLTVMGGVEMLFAARATLEFGFSNSSDDPAVRQRFVRETLSIVLQGIEAP
jgi:TetR/AcrR family transcriptional regulator